MPTKTTTTSRFSRTGTPRGNAGRFSKPLSVQRPSQKGRKAKSQGGLADMLTSVASRGGQTSKGRARRPTGAGGGKAKPAMALLGLAGAVLGRRQMSKRKRADATDMSTPAA